MTLHLTFCRSTDAACDSEVRELARLIDRDGLVPLCTRYERSGFFGQELLVETLHDREAAICVDALQRMGGR